jgi:hypothetical protein
MAAGALFCAGDGNVNVVSISNRAKNLRVINGKVTSKPPGRKGRADNEAETQSNKLIAGFTFKGQADNRAALQEAVTLPNGLRLVLPAWLVILKYNAGRQKDLDDIVFLLKQPQLVDRPAVKQKVLATAGEDARLTMLAGFRPSVI